MPLQLSSALVGLKHLAAPVIALFLLSVTVKSLLSLLPLLAPPVPRRLLPVMTGSTFLMAGRKILSDKWLSFPLPPSLTLPGHWEQVFRLGSLSPPARECLARRGQSRCVGRVGSMLAFIAGGRPTSYRAVSKRPHANGNNQKSLGERISSRFGHTASCRLEHCQ